MNHRKLVFIPSRLHAGQLRLLRGQRRLHVGRGSPQVPLTHGTHGRVFGAAPSLACLQDPVADVNEEMLLFCFALTAIHGFPILFQFCNRQKKKKKAFSKP